MDFPSAISILTKVSIEGLTKQLISNTNVINTRLIMETLIEQDLACVVVGLN